ncbi:MAG TPA: toll/interleukin-1 receptor domain-containing protein [Streptosporangiaceae bacterium]|nr:toll/interleukin-1 receptor domain-containing protein [Streptosporangiaceae bacterium]
MELDNTDGTEGTVNSKRPSIFIVYANHEHKLASALKDLLETWGFRAFFCRQEIRSQAASEPYRQELREELTRADLVILLLSNAFQHSSYCQAEAGVTVSRDKPQIQILIPPVGNADIKRISPVLEGWELIDGSKPQEVGTQLRNKLSGQFTVLKHADAETAAKCETAVETALTDVIEAYRVEPPDQAGIGVWPSLTDVRTRDSIVTHIRRAVEAGETHLAVVGVSLKYSIHIITEAISGLSPGLSRTSAGPLTIELVHMDDQSHILNSLNDTLDIDSVLTYFHISWLQTKASWEMACNNVGIMVDVREPVAIDYIPQQVGIRIESVEDRWSVLYAGQCSFERAGIGARLLVGEREYFFYTSSSADPRGQKAIEVFNQYFRQYRSPEYNGVTLVGDHHKWIERLESCVSNYSELRQVTLISNSGQKLFPLIMPALTRRLAVKIYTCDPDLLSGIEELWVRSIRDRIQEEIWSQLGGECPGKVELRHFHDTPTFRAAVIGEAVLGLEPYLIQRAIAPSRPLTPSAMRLIVTKHSEHFSRLNGMVTRFLQGAKADAEPYAALGNLNLQQ